MSISLLDVDNMRQRTMEASHLLNDEIPMIHDAKTLILKLTEERERLIDYILILERYIKENHKEE